MNGGFTGLSNTNEVLAVRLVWRLARRRFSAAHEVRDELRNLIRRGIEREVPAVHDVHFGLWHIAAIGFRLRGVE